MIIDLISLKNLIIGNWPYITLNDEITSELDSSFISLKFVDTKRWVIFQISNENIYIYFGNKNISGTILELLLSLVTSLIFSTPYVWKTKFSKNVISTYFLP